MEEKTAVGVAEFSKLTSAIAFIDTAVKAAGVRLIGWELTGGGLVTMKLAGNVAAVQAAMDAGIAASAGFGGTFGYTVLARPHAETERILRGRTPEYPSGSEDQNPRDKAPGTPLPTPEAEEAEPTESEEPAQVPETHAVSAQEEPNPKSLVQEDMEPEGRSVDDEAPEQIRPEAEPRAEERRPTCNLCGDINCPRTKYQPHKECIHYKERWD